MHRRPAPTNIAIQLPASDIKAGDWIWDDRSKTWVEVWSASTYGDQTVIVTPTGVLTGPSYAGATVGFV